MSFADKSNALQIAGTTFTFPILLGIRRETRRHTSTTNRTLGKWKIQPKTKHTTKNSRCIERKCK